MTSPGAGSGSVTSRQAILPGAELSATSARMRLAAWAMSRPSLGMPESPMPGRSGAMTVKRVASVRIKGRHIRDVSA